MQLYIASTKEATQVELLASFISNPKQELLNTDIVYLLCSKLSSGGLFLEFSPQDIDKYSPQILEPTFFT